MPRHRAKMAGNVSARVTLFRSASVVSAQTVTSEICANTGQVTVKLNVNQQPIFESNRVPSVLKRVPL